MLRFLRLLIGFALLAACENPTSSPVEAAAGQVEETIEAAPTGEGTMSHTSPGMKSGVGL